MAAKALQTFRRADRQCWSSRAACSAPRRVDTEQILALARLPARDVLYGQLVGIVASPITGLVRTLNALIAGLALQLAQIAEKKESGEIPAGEPPAARPRRPRLRRPRSRCRGEAPLPRRRLPLPRRRLPLPRRRLRPRRRRLRARPRLPPRRLPPTTATEPAPAEAARGEAAGEETPAENDDEADASA